MMPVVVIQGPTAVGKSSFALRLAEMLQTEIISADSRQVYKMMDIGTAKPDQHEQQRVRHHLIDIIDPDDEYSAGAFAAQAAEIIADLHDSGRIPIIAGGTGFYIKALLKGIFKAPIIPPEIRQKLKCSAEEKGAAELYEKLSVCDPESAEKIDPHDLNRLIRALEVYEATGKSITQLRMENPAEENDLKPFNILITKERQLLYDRINIRVEKMIEKGLTDEIKYLLQLGFAPNSPGFNTVGYKELLPHFLDGADLDNCIALIKQHTRNYAKRQLTWYRSLEFDLTLSDSDINFSIVLEKIKKQIKV